MDTSHLAARSFAARLITPACLLLLFACGRDDIGLIDRALHDHPFFTKLGTIPAPVSPYAESTAAVDARRVYREPDIDYEILVDGSEGTVNISVVWPCTLYIVYPAGDGVDTLAKPGPHITGLAQSRFGYNGSEWRMTGASPCDARSDSGFRFLEIDSLRLSARRDGDTVSFPGIRNMTRRTLDPWPFTFRAGDSVDISLWQHDTVDAPGAFLHLPWSGDATPFRQDTAGTWSCTWVLSDTGRGWAWFEVFDIADGINDPGGPDRTVLWGLPCIVEPR